MRASRVKLLLSILLGSHVLLIIYSAWCHSPTVDEVGHLPAGLVIWNRGRFDLYSVNPPLAKAVAALPVLLLDFDASALSYNSDPQLRAEWSVGAQLVSDNPDQFRWMWFLARCACIPISVIGGLLCFFWSNRLFGSRGGLLSTALWCFSPQMISQGSIISPDLCAATFGMAAAYVFVNWLETPTWKTAAIAGIVLGLALLSKLTLIVLLALWPILWCVARRPWRSKAVSSWRSQLLMLLTILGIGIHTLNMGYLYCGSFRPLGEYEFQSEFLSGSPANVTNDTLSTGNRFSGTLFGRLPVPLPEDYVLGADVQKVDFERRKWSYLFGEHKFGGWWYYYLVSLLFKAPLGTLALVGLSFVILAQARSRLAKKDLAVLVTVPITLLGLVSMQTGFTEHLRYLMPAYPFVFIICGCTMSRFDTLPTGVRPAAILFVVWSVGSSLWHFPHSMSYFNELAGGPENGHFILNGSNISWGQDLFFSKIWIDEHPDAQPLFMSWSGGFDPYHAGLDLPGSYEVSANQRDDGQRRVPQTGWHIVDVYYLRHHNKQFDCFLEFTPVDSIGYSLHVYHLSEDDVNRFKASLGAE